MQAELHLVRRTQFPDLYRERLDGTRQKQLGRTNGLDSSARQAAW